MKILIELYDREPVFNYLATMFFRPEKVYFVGGKKVVSPQCRIKTEKLAKIMGFDGEFVFRAFKSPDFSDIKSGLESIIAAERAKGNSCVIDVTGGGDLALVAAGCLMGNGTEIVRYDINSNLFRNFSTGESAEFNINIPCNAFITAAGGTIYGETRSTDYSEKELALIRNLIEIYFRNRDNWNRFVKYLQRISKKEGEKVGDSLIINAPMTLSDGGKNFFCDEDILRELESAGAIRNSRIDRKNQRIGFEYASSLLANLLVNEGVWLELCVYLAAKDTPALFDAQTGVKFVWDVPEKNISVQKILSDTTPRNEVDVMFARGVMPVFVSCKTRYPINEDLNELYAIKENFGGKISAAILATTKSVDSDSPIAERARALGIGIVDERNFENGTVSKRLLRLTGD